jgi:hypothetical protein
MWTGHFAYDYLSTRPKRQLIGSSVAVAYGSMSPPQRASRFRGRPCVALSRYDTEGRGLLITLL